MAQASLPRGHEGFVAWKVEVATLLVGALGRSQSPLHVLDGDSLRKILHAVFEATGVERWRWVTGDGDSNSLHDYTTLRHVAHGTIVQLAHSKSCGVLFRPAPAGPNSGCFYSVDGEVHRHRLHAEESVARLDAGEGEMVPHDGLRAGRWIVQFHGPDLSVAHLDHEEQHLVLDADGFKLTAPPSAVAQLLGAHHCFGPRTLEVHKSTIAQTSEGCTAPVSASVSDDQGDRAAKKRRQQYRREADARRLKPITNMLVASREI